MIALNNLSGRGLNERGNHDPILYMWVGDQCLEQPFLVNIFWTPGVS